MPGVGVCGVILVHRKVSLEGYRQISGAQHWRWRRFRRCSPGRKKKGGEDNFILRPAVRHGVDHGAFLGAQQVRHGGAASPVLPAVRPAGAVEHGLHTAVHREEQAAQHVGRKR